MRRPLRLGLRSALLVAVAVPAPVASWLGGGHAPVAAQAPADSLPADSVRYLGGITVSVGRPQLVLGGSSAVELDVDSLARAPTPSLADVLRSAPLVQVRTNSRGEAQPALRGSRDRQVAILVDGVPLTLGWDHRTDMSIIPLTAAGNVTLVRGLPSVLYGPNTLGGVVEVDVARAGDRLEEVDPLTVAAALDQTRGTDLAVTGGRLSGTQGGQWALRAGLGLQDRRRTPLAAQLSDDPTLRPHYLSEGSDGEGRLNSDVRRVDGFVTTRYRSGAGAWASLSASAFDVERGVPPEAHQDAPRLWRYPDQKRLIAALSAGTGMRDTGLGEGDLEASVGLDVGSTRIEQFASEAFESVVGSEEADDRVVTLRLLGDHTLGARGDVRAAATFAGVAHDEVLTPGGANDYRQRLWSVAAESAWRLGPGGGTTMSLGAALDGADTPETGDQPPLGALTDYGVRIGASSVLGRDVLLHAAYSRRARFPSLRELYSGALGRFEPNPELRAETLEGLEAGLTVRRAGGELQLVGFRHLLEDGIVRATVTGSDGSARFQRINRAEVRSTGLELLAAAAFGGATVSGDLTLQTVRGVEANGAEAAVEYEPKAYGQLRVEGPLLEALRAGLEARFVGGQWCANPELGDLERLAGSGSLDVILRRVFTLGTGGALRRWGATLTVSNLTDEAVYGQCGLPEPGRLVRFQLRVW